MQIFSNSRNVFAAAALLMFSSFCLSGCEKSRDSNTIETPESWQPHLTAVAADKLPNAVIEESVYVPIYSHIYVEDRMRSALLAATLSVRNTDPNSSLILTSAKYYSTDGKMLQEFLPSPVRLNPMATANFVVSRPDESGGSGANFIVTWRASSKVVDPILESVMVGTGTSQSFAFTSRGVVIARHVGAEIQKIPVTKSVQSTGQLSGQGSGPGSGRDAGQAAGRTGGEGASQNTGSTSGTKVSPSSATKADQAKNSDNQKDKRQVKPDSKPSSKAGQGAPTGGSDQMPPTAPAITPQEVPPVAPER